MADIPYLPKDQRDLLKYCQVNGCIDLNAGDDPNGVTLMNLEMHDYIRAVVYEITEKGIKALEAAQTTPTLSE